MHSVLITGANSFVGTNYRLFSKFSQVREICLIENTPDDIDFTGVDVVLHVAAIVHQTKGIPESEYYRVNRDLCLEVAKKAKKNGVKQFVFLSTIKVYGNFQAGSLPWKEDSSCNPIDSYGKSKYQAEGELNKLANQEFTISIVRTPLVYGPGVRANMQNLINLVKRFPVLPFGRINNKRCFTYVRNLVELLDNLIDRRASGVFIAMDEVSLSTTEMVMIISEALNKKRVLFMIPRFLVKLGLLVIPNIFDRLFNSFELDNLHTRNVLDYWPSYTSKEGIIRTVKQLD
jgi:nucleoside-diphosphate-sugar epimerase